MEDKNLSKENSKLEYVASFPANAEASFLAELVTQTVCPSKVNKKRQYFIDQATFSKNCYRYTRANTSRLDLVVEFLDPKFTEMRLWLVVRTPKFHQISHLSEDKRRSRCQFPSFFLALIRLKYPGFTLYG